METDCRGPDAWRNTAIRSNPQEFWGKEGDERGGAQSKRERERLRKNKREIERKGEIGRAHV